MKLPCSIVRELLPLYMDGCLEPENHTLLEEHLKECPDCARRLEAERQVIDPAAAAGADNGEAETVRSSVKKVKKRLRFLSLKGAAAILLSLLLLWLGINQTRRMGVCFTNLDELTAAQLFMADLESGDYASAYDRMDAAGYYDSLLAYWKENPGEEAAAETWVEGLEALGKEAYVRQGKELFCRYLEETDFSSMLGAYQYGLIYKVDDQGWVIEYNARMGDATECITIHCGEDGGFTASGGYDLTLDSGLTCGVLCGWQHQLWEEYCP